jgi:hypothetical protein
MLFTVIRLVDIVCLLRVFSIRILSAVLLNKILHPSYKIYLNFIKI